MSFKVSSRFVETAAIINNIPTEKLPLLIKRILQKLHIKNARLFSEEEETQLMNLFAFNLETLQKILACLSYVFEQAAFTNTAPPALYDILLSAGFEESHGKIIGKAWATEATEFMTKMKDQRLGYRCLTGIDYHLNMIMGQDDLTRQQEPVALFEFQINNTPDLNNVENAQKDDEKFCVEFNHPELYSFFLQLERIQHQVDGLGKS